MGTVIEIKPGIRSERGEGVEQDYGLTDEERDEVMGYVFEAESVVRVLKDNCYDKGNSPGESSQAFMDVANCLVLVEDKLKIILKVLDK